MPPLWQQLEPGHLLFCLFFSFGTSFCKSLLFIFCSAMPTLWDQKRKYLFLCLLDLSVTFHLHSDSVHLFFNKFSKHCYQNQLFVQPITSEKIRQPKTELHNVQMIMVQNIDDVVHDLGKPMQTGFHFEGKSYCSIYKMGSPLTQRRLEYRATFLIPFKFYKNNPVFEQKEQYIQ